jgi:hypothetical protein
VASPDRAFFGKSGLGGYGWIIGATAETILHYLMAKNS